MFIEYAPLERAWVPVEGPGYLYVHCLWVSGSYKGKGHAGALLQSCLDDARTRKRAGVCVLSADKKKPFLSDKGIFVKYGFEVVDTLPGGYQLLALSLDGSLPKFTDAARAMRITDQELTIYYAPMPLYPGLSAPGARRVCAGGHPPAVIGGQHRPGQGASLRVQQLGRVLQGQFKRCICSTRIFTKDAGRRIAPGLFQPSGVVYSIDYSVPRSAG